MLLLWSEVWIHSMRRLLFGKWIDTTTDIFFKLSILTNWAELYSPHNAHLFKQTQILNYIYHDIHVRGHF